MAGKLVQAIPMLASTSIAASVAFYREKLGFAAVYEDEGTAVIQRDSVKLHLWRCDDSTIPADDACRMQVENFDALFEHCRAKSIVHPNGPLTLKPWGLREFTILEPSGAAITFFEQP